MLGLLVLCISAYAPEVAAGPGSTQYQYDALGRLTQVTSPEGLTQGYAYDAAGNRISIATSSYLSLTFLYGQTGAFGIVGLNSDSGAWVAVTNLTNAGGGAGTNITLTSHTFTGGPIGAWAWSNTGAGNCSFGSMTSPATVLAPGATCMTFVGIGSASPPLGSYAAIETVGFQVAGLTGTYTQSMLPVGMTIASTAQSPGSLTFGTTSLGKATPAQSVVYTNQATNGGPLKSVNVYLSGAQASSFQIASNTCGSGAGSVAPGATCSISVTLTPTAATSYSAALILTGGYDRMQPGDSGLLPTPTGVTLSAALSGSGAPPPVIASAAFSPSTVTSGTSSTFTWSTSSATSATVACTGAVTGSSSGTSGNLAIATSAAGTGTCTVTALNSIGDSVTASSTLTIVGPPTVTSATFSATAISPSGTTTFSWATSGAATASVNCTSPVVGSGAGLNGTITVTGAAAAGIGSCTVTATNAANVSASKQATLIVSPAITSLSLAFPSTGGAGVSCGGTTAAVNFVIILSVFNGHSYSLPSCKMTVTPVGGAAPFTYTWTSTPFAINVVTTSFSTNSVLHSVAAPKVGTSTATDTVTITDANGRITAFAVPFTLQVH